MKQLLILVFIKVNLPCVVGDSFIYLARKLEASVVQNNWQWAPLVQEILVEIKKENFRQQRDYSSARRWTKKNEFFITLFKVFGYKNLFDHIPTIIFSLEVSFSGIFDGKWEIRRTPSKRSALLFLS